MPRLRQVRRDEAHDFAQTMYRYIFGDRDPVAEPGTSSGTPGDWWTVAALVPDAFDHMVGAFAYYQSADRVLDPKLRELAQTRTGWTKQSQFVFSQHCKQCRTVGITDEQIESIPSWSTADCFSPTQRAVLAYTDALTLEDGRVSDDLFAALQAALSDEEILELTYITLTYAMHAVMSRALRLEYDDVPERVVEIPGGPVDPNNR